MMIIHINKGDFSMLYNPFSTNELVSEIPIKGPMSIECLGEYVVYRFHYGALDPSVDCGSDFRLTSRMKLYETDEKYIIMDEDNEWGAEIPKAHSQLLAEEVV